jgi:hypothetical protein
MAMDRQRLKAVPTNGSAANYAHLLQANPAAIASMQAVCRAAVERSERLSPTEARALAKRIVTVNDRRLGLLKS